MKTSRDDGIKQHQYTTPSYISFHIIHVYSDLQVGCQKLLVLHLWLCGFYGHIGHEYFSQE